MSLHSSKTGSTGTEITLKGGRKGWESEILRKCYKVLKNACHLAKKIKQEIHVKMIYNLTTFI